MHPSDLISRGRTLYDALKYHDSQALRALLSADFQGELTAGLPHGLGRVYEGRETLISEAWSRIGLLFDIEPRVESLYDAGNALIARGSYAGSAISTGAPLNAAFAHFWTFDGSLFTHLYQITDSAAWERALT